MTIDEYNMYSIQLDISKISNNKFLDKNVNEYSLKELIFLLIAV